MVLLLDLARGLACLWVFFFHVQYLFEEPSPFIASVASFGHLGVPMFFVISGYVITFAAESSRSSGKPPLTFLKNRFKRIYLTYWASLLLVLLLPYGLELLSSIKSGHYAFPDNLLGRYNTGEWINVILLTKVFWASSNDLASEFAAINSVYWTLAIEFQFYLVVFIALCTGKYYRVVIALVTLASLLLTFAPNTLNYGLFLHYWPALSVGIVLAYLHKNGIELHINSARNVAVLIVLSALTLAYAMYLHPIQIRTQFLGFALIFATLLWLYSDLERVLQHLKQSNNWLVYILLEPWLVLGAMSYSVYLLHLKLLSLPFMFTSHLFDTDGVALGLVTIVSTLILTYPFYYFVERRFLSKRYKVIQQVAVRIPGR